MQNGLLIIEIDISWIMTYAGQIENEKLQKIRMRESKKDHIEGGYFSASLVVAISNNAKGHPRVILYGLIGIGFLPLRSW